MRLLNQRGGGFAPQLLGQRGRGFDTPLRGYSTSGAAARLLNRRGGGIRNQLADVGVVRVLRIDVIARVETELGDG